MKRISLPHIPRPHLPRRTPREPGETVPAVPPGTVLRSFRHAALWAVAVLITAATGAAFAEWYQGLYEWARHHGKTGVWATLYPLQIDVFIAVPELVLFIAMVDGWKRRSQIGAWTLALIGLAVSVAGNIGHETVSDLQSRGTAAVPPLAAFAALWLGFGVIKRVIARRPGAGGTVHDKAPLEAVETPVTDTVSSPVRGSAETAAEASLRATLAAGNPWPINQLSTRFRLSRTEATNLRSRVLAEVNGHAAGEGPAGTVS